MNLLVRFTPSLGYLMLLIYSMGSSAGEITIIIEDKKQRPLHDTVVELVGTDFDTTTADNIEITQINKEFTPEISVIARGSSVTFTNKDPFQHHVYSVSKGNQFDLPLYQGAPSKRIVFDTPGIAKLGCNIHDWMLAFAYVSQSKRIIITDSSGKAHFTDLPGGEYQLRVWNPRLKKNKKILSQPLSLSQDQSLTHTVQVALRKKVRKPPRIEKDNDY